MADSPSLGCHGWEGESQYISGMDLCDAGLRSKSNVSMRADLISLQIAFKMYASHF